MIRSRRRTLLFTAGIAVVALVAGLVAGQFIRSPADAASRAEAPDASVITVPVERRVLETEIRTRGDAAFAGSVEITLELGGLETPPVVTGHVPERGDEIAEGEPLLEVVGRPILALAGELPMYRSLSPGMSGPDVTQLKQTLRRLGLNPGADDDRYTWATGEAVAELFRRAGYQPPQPDPAVAADLQAAQEALTAAEDELAAAEDALAALADAEPEPPEAELAEARRRVERAKEAREGARRDHTEAQSRAGTPLPISEVYYLPTLPRHVDSVGVARGDLAEGVVMSVSSSDLQITTGDLSEADRAALTEGMAATLHLPTGEVVGTVVEVAAAAVIEPPDLTGEEIDALLEQGNILVVIPVESTGGEVLAVPLAALTAGPDGESRVEVQRAGAPTTELVAVEVGLVAQGYAEVTAVDGELAEGDLVVVGEAADEPEAR